MKADILDSLFGYRDALSNLIITNSPATPAEQPAFQSLLQQRDRLTGAINQVIEAQFKNATVDLTKSIADIDAATATVKGVTNNISGIQQAITVTDTVVKTVASVIALVV